MSGKRKKYMRFWDWVAKITALRFNKDELSITSEWARVDADPNVGKTPILVRYKYHRYFYKAAQGNGTRHIMAHAILN